MKQFEDISLTVTRALTEKEIQKILDQRRKYGEEVDDLTEEEKISTVHNVLNTDALHTHQDFSEVIQHMHEIIIQLTKDNRVLLERMSNRAMSHITGERLDMENINPMSIDQIRSAAESATGLDLSREATAPR